MSDNLCHIPVIGYMVPGPDGNYHLDEERSTWADIPADTIARFLIEKCGADAIFGGEEAVAVDS